MALTALHISFSYGEHIVIKDVSIELVPGRVSVLMGTNGSGKTTLLNVLSGFLPQSAGEKYIDSRCIDKLEPYRINRMGLGRTFQNMRLIGNLSVKENVMLAFPRQEGEKWYRTLLPSHKVLREQSENSNRADEILRICFIEDVADSMASEISYGQQKLLNLACCMASGTSVWLLDEPVAGVNPAYREKLSEIIRQQKCEGRAMFIIEHNSDFIEEIADEILFLHDGAIRRFGSYAEFRNDENVKNAYV